MDSDTGTGSLACKLAYPVAQPIMQSCQESCLFPLSKVIADVLPRSKIIRKGSPLASGFVDIKQGVTDRAQGMFSFALEINEGFEKLPLGIGQVGVLCVACSALVL